MTVFENVAFGLRVRPAASRPSNADHRREGHRAAEARAAGLPGRSLSHRAVRRPAAARGAGPGAGGGTQGAAARRAVRRAGCEGPAGAAALAAPASRGDSSHQRVRHARSGRSARAGRSSGDHERRPGGAGRDSPEEVFERPASAVRDEFSRQREHFSRPRGARARTSWAAVGGLPGASTRRIRVRPPAMRARTSWSSRARTTAAAACGRHCPPSLLQARLCGSSSMTTTESCCRWKLARDTFDDLAPQSVSGCTVRPRKLRVFVTKIRDSKLTKDLLACSELGGSAAPRKTWRLYPARFRPTRGRRAA